IAWWRADLSLPLLIVAYLAVSGLLVLAARRPVRAQVAS
ncbi:MAG: hypothetical protein QOI11_1503, partial [Candidatus Eremiobacteraeota bacterium]|nr:hypothetical protein [Candidatus Eremiobacteraeota bacterium]